LVLGVAAWLIISNITGTMKTMVDSTVRKQTLANRVALDSSVLLSDLRGEEVRGFLKDIPAIEKYHEEFLQTADEQLADIETIVPMLSLAAAKQDVEEIREASTAIRAGEQEAYKAAIAGDMEASVAAQKALIPVQQRQSASTIDLLKIQDELIVSASTNAHASADSSRWITGFLLALSCAVGVVVIFIVRQVNSQLRETAVELSESAVQIASAANQVASSSQSLAQGASEQAATIEETSSASSEINSMAHRNTENSRTTADLVTSSQAGFAKTNQSLDEMVGAMDGINASSQKISKIIKVIDEIAFQTNILALNAAVEAARAGEAGMGFAVVADEVRNLAQRCAQAARDTAELIEDSIQRSDSGKAKVDQVAIAVRASTAESSKIKILVDEINLGSIEQSRGIDQISKAVGQMEQVTQSSAASAEEGAAAAEQLTAQAEAMKDIVERLKLMVDGHSGYRGTTSISSSRPVRSAA
jgi:methyl-accepting chemotaxis protein/methyl-accepting chemotaxis protein-1 (serine sensor receptor)